MRCSYSGHAGRVHHGDFSENVEATTARPHVRRCTLAAPTPHRLSDTSEVAVLSGEQRMTVPTLVLNSLQSENAHHGQYDSGDIPPLTAWFFSSALRNADHYKWMFLQATGCVYHMSAKEQCRQDCVCGGANRQEVPQYLENSCTHSMHSRDGDVNIPCL